MPEEVVLDAPVDVAPVSDAPEPTSSPSEPADSPEPTSETPDPAAPEPAAPEAKGLSEQDKAALAEIQAKNPALAGRLRRSLFADQQYRQIFAGGVKEAREARQFIEMVGGPEGWQQVQASKAEQAEVDGWIAAADPKIFDRVAKQAPEAFPKLLVAALSKYRETQPYGHAAHVMQAVLGDMQAHDIPLTMALLGRVIGDNPEAKQLFGQLNSYFGQMKQLSEQKDEPEAAKAPQGNDVDKQKQELSAEREKFERDQWGASNAASLNQFYNSELSTLLKGRKVSEDMMGTILRETKWRLAERWQAKNGLASQLDKFFANRDRDGYNRLSLSHYKKDVPEILRKVVAIQLPGKPGPVAAAAAPVNGAPKPAPTGAAADGFIRVASSPATNEINMHPTYGTTNAMFMQGRAILKSGKKVQWK